LSKPIVHGIFSMLVVAGVHASALSVEAIHARYRNEIIDLEKRLEGHISRHQKVQIVKQIHKIQVKESLQILALKQLRRSFERSDPVAKHAREIFQNADLNATLSYLSRADSNLSRDAEQSRLLLRAELLKLLGKEDAADEAYDRATQISPDPQILYEYALFLQNHRRSYDAIDLYEELLEDIKHPESLTDQALLATVWNNLGNLYYRIRDFKKAQAFYIKSRALKESLASKAPAAYEPSLTLTLKNFTLFYADTRQKEKAASLYRAYRKLSEDLYAKDPQKYAVGYAQSLIVGFVLFKQGGQALQHAKRILQEAPPSDKVRSILKTIRRLQSKHRAIPASS